MQVSCLKRNLERAVIRMAEKKSVGLVGAVSALAGAAVGAVVGAVAMVMSDPKQRQVVSDEVSKAVKKGEKKAKVLVSRGKKLLKKKLK